MTSIGMVICGLLTHAAPEALHSHSEQSAHRGENRPIVDRRAPPPRSKEQA